MGSKTYRDLELWQTAMDLVVECDQAARRFPRHETFGLAGQLRRAAVSVPANVAEGHGRQHRLEFIQHARRSTVNGPPTTENRKPL